MIAAMSTVSGLSCAPRSRVEAEGSTQDSLLVLMPESIRIVEAFTTWTSLSERPGIDGIGVYVQPVNASGDPIQAVGSMFVELYRYLQASADHRGERVGVWDFPLASQSDQDARWHRATQMYEFPLVLPREVLSTDPGSKFVLLVTYNPPLGDRRFADYIVEAPLATGVFAGPR